MVNPKMPRKWVVLGPKVGQKWVKHGFFQKRSWTIWDAQTHEMRSFWARFEPFWPTLSPKKAMKMGHFGAKNGTKYYAVRFGMHMGVS